MKSNIPGVVAVVRPTEDEVARAQAARAAQEMVRRSMRPTPEHIADPMLTAVSDGGWDLTPMHLASEMDHEVRLSGAPRAGRSERPEQAPWERLRKPANTADGITGFLGSLGLWMMLPVAAGAMGVVHWGMPSALAWSYGRGAIGMGTAIGMLAGLAIGVLTSSRGNPAWRRLAVAGALSGLSLDLTMTLAKSAQAESALRLLAQEGTKIETSRMGVALLPGLAETVVGALHTTRSATGARSKGAGKKGARRARAAQAAQVEAADADFHGTEGDPSRLAPPMGETDGVTLSWADVAHLRVLLSDSPLPSQSGLVSRLPSGEETPPVRKGM